jgi:peptidoglycan/LPS O-acetylase OafA/YrhL
MLALSGMSRTQEITDLTVCRGVFAAWVFIYHVDLYLDFSRWLGPAADLVRHGYLGVDGFFILSGLILGRVYVPPPATVRAALLFWGRRLARLYPVHLATIVIMAALVLGGRYGGVAAHDPSRFSLLSLVENLALVQGWGATSFGQWNYPSWSISSEWAGYLLFPLIAGLVAYFEIIVAAQFLIIAFAAVGLITYLHGYSLNISFGAGLLRFFPEFIAGVATARCVPRIADNAPLRVLVGMGTGLAVLAAALGFDLFVVVGIWLVLYSLAMRADAERPPMLHGTGWLRWFGLLSYAFYMSFAVIELILTRLFATPAAHAWLFALGMLGGTLALAMALHFAVERPARRAIDRWLDAQAAHR